MSNTFVIMNQLKIDGCRAEEGWLENEKVKQKELRDFRSECEDETKTEWSSLWLTHANGEDRTHRSPWVK